jgi:hypothetical protein
MKIKFTEQIEREIEIKFPAFRKNGCHFYKIVSENVIIGVTELDRWMSISQTVFECAYDEGSIEINEKEFEEAYIRVTKILNGLKND